MKEISGYQGHQSEVTIYLYIVITTDDIIFSIYTYFMYVYVVNIIIIINIL